MVDEHVEFVARTLRRAGVPASDLDDEVQRTFLVAAKKIDGVQAGSERGFLCSVAQNLAFRARRTLARRREVLQGDPPDVVESVATPEFLAEQKQLGQLYDEIVGGMHESLRSVFTMFELEEMTMTEIATMLGLPRGTVASRLRRAREQFRQHAAAVELESVLPGPSLRGPGAAGARAARRAPERAADRRHIGVHVALDPSEDAFSSRIGRARRPSLLMLAAVLPFVP